MFIFIIEIDHWFSTSCVWFDWIDHWNFTLDYESFPIWYSHTTHKTFVEQMLISFVCLCVLKCDVCVLNHMWIKPKRFLFFLFAFGNDLYHPCFSKFFKLFLWEKHVFWVFFMTHFMSKLYWELNGSILKFFNFRQRVSRLFRE